VIQLKTIQDFCKNASYIMVRFEKTENEEFGKILTNKEIMNLDLSKNEIRRSITNVNDDRLFVFDLLPEEGGVTHNSPLQLVKSNLKDARIIEKVYPQIFSWAFDGVSIRCYAIIPSGNPKAHSTISRYGGTDMFYKILRQHLKNIANMSRGKTPDYNFLQCQERVPETEIAIGSINRFNNMYAIGIGLKSSYIDIISNSINNKNALRPLKTLNMKYWAREINPDFIVEAKYVKLKEPLELDLKEAYELYPKAIKNLMALPHKGNYQRFLLTRFLLSVHKPSDAKFIYYSVLGDEDLKHVKYGNCKTQWNYILNNMYRYSCPTFQELSQYADPEDEGLSHPLEKIQKYMDEKKNGENSKDKL